MSDVRRVLLPPLLRAIFDPPKQLYARGGGAEAERRAAAAGSGLSKYKDHCSAN